MKKRTLTETKQSELLRRAVADAQEAEKKPGVRLNMMEWACAGDSYGECEVCMAGAIMLALDEDTALETNDPDWFAQQVGDPSLGKKLLTVNEMRKGNFFGDTVEEEEAAFGAGQTVSDAFDYELDRAPWDAYLQAAAILEKAGL